MTSGLESVSSSTASRLPTKQELESLSLNAVVLERHTMGVNWVSFSNDGFHIATCSDDTLVIIWDGLTYRPIRALRGHSAGVNHCAFAKHNSRQLASASDDCTVRIWNYFTRACLRTLDFHSAAVCCVAFSADGVWLASNSTDGRTAICAVDNYVLEQLKLSTATRMKLNECNEGSELNLTYAYRRLCFSPRLLETQLTVAMDNSLVIWSLAGGMRSQWQTRSVLSAHRGSVYDVQYSRNGALIVSTSMDCTARIWNAHTGELKHTVNGHSERDMSAWMRTAAFICDGQMLVTGDDKGQVKVWLTPHSTAISSEDSSDSKKSDSEESHCVATVTEHKKTMFGVYTGQLPKRAYYMCQFLRLCASFFFA